MTRIFLNGVKSPVQVQESADEVLARIESRPRVAGVIRLTGRHGEPVAFVGGAYIITSVVGDAPPADEPPDVRGIFDGRKVTFRLANTWIKEQPPIETWDDYDDDAVVVLAEDMAEAPVCIIDVTDSQVLWANPASDEASIAAYAQAVTFAARAEAIEVQVQTANADRAAIANPLADTSQA